MSILDIFKQPTETIRTDDERITNVLNDITLLKARLNSLELTNDDLRNKVLRKIQRRADYEEEQPTIRKAGQKVR
jgi:hypothetical protein